MFEKTINNTAIGLTAQFHIISSIYCNDPLIDAPTFIVIVSSFENQATYMSGIKALFETKEYVPYSVFKANLSKSVEDYILLNDTSIFFGGISRSALPTDPLEYCREKKKAVLKSNRDKAIAKINGDMSNSEITNILDTAKNTYQDLKNMTISATSIQEIESIFWPVNL